MENINSYSKPFFISYDSLFEESENIKNKEIREKLEEIAAFGVDINSMVSRTPRKKDYDKLHNIISNIQRLF
ncbi:hypothetical protein ACFL4O_02860 [bacterium]